MTATKTQDTTPPAVSQPVQRLLTAIEGEAFDASAELVFVREHHAEYDRLDSRRDGLVHRLIAAAAQGDTRSVRALAPQVQAADRACDEAVERASTRRAAAHTHTKRIASVVETVLTGRAR